MSQTKKKTPAAEIKEYLSDLLPHLVDAGIKLLVVTHPEYFKVLTKQSKTDVTIGDILPCVVKDFEVTYCPYYKRIFYDPDKIKPKIERCFTAVRAWVRGDNKAVGKDIIKYADFPTKDDDIIAWLEKLYQMDVPLTVDIEGFDLKHYDAGIGTITFCWSKHEGIAFPVDYAPVLIGKGKGGGQQITNHRIRRALKKFFESFQNKLIYHNICYDVYVLIYQLFMDHLLDQEGMLYGMEVMLKNWDCTKILSYLATNSCAGNELGLKAQAQEFAGNYAVEEIHDITLIPMMKLLRYNLIDGLSTWFVHDKHMPTVIADDQLIPYHDLFRPAVLDVIQMQLTGMPMNMEKVLDLDNMLQAEARIVEKRLLANPLIMSFVDVMKDEFVVKKNASYKKKVITTADVRPKDVFFNVNSGPQLQRFLYGEDFLGLPVLDLTDSGLPATGSETLEKLMKQTIPDEARSFLADLVEYKASAIILSTFLPAFKRAVKADDGWHYLFGNFNLGGTVSGRLSSNKPNLTNIPSSASSKHKARLAKLIKECFEAPPGWLWVGIDFDSLEDKISAVTTKDPEKIKVYSEGYDGHCLRAQSYFREHMPDIELCPADTQAFKAELDGVAIYFHATETIEYLGEQITGQELYERLSNHG